MSKRNLMLTIGPEILKYRNREVTAINDYIAIIICSVFAILTNNRDISRQHPKMVKTYVKLYKALKGRRRKTTRRQIALQYRCTSRLSFDQA